MIVPVYVIGLTRCVANGSTGGISNVGSTGNAGCPNWSIGFFVVFIGDFNTGVATGGV